MEKRGNKKPAGAKNGKRKNPHCNRCQNHNIWVSTRQHKCPYKEEHSCELCQITTDAQTLMRYQQRWWRHQNHKLESELKTKKRKGQVCDKCRNHQSIVNKSGHNCPYENDHTCKMCDLSKKRRQVMKHHQKARRQGITMTIDAASGKYVMSRIKVEMTVISDEPSSLEPKAGQQRKASPEMCSSSADKFEVYKNNKYFCGEELPTEAASHLYYTKNHIKGNPFNVKQEKIESLSDEEKKYPNYLVSSMNGPSKSSAQSALPYKYKNVICPTAIRAQPCVASPQKSRFPLIDERLSIPQLASNFRQCPDNQFRNANSPTIYSRLQDLSLTAQHYQLKSDFLTRGNSSYGPDRTNEMLGLQYMAMSNANRNNSNTSASLRDFPAFPLLEPLECIRPETYFFRAGMPGYNFSEIPRPPAMPMAQPLTHPLNSLEGMTQMLHLRSNLNTWSSLAKSQTASFVDSPLRPYNFDSSAQIQNQLYSFPKYFNYLLNKQL